MSPDNETVSMMREYSFRLTFGGSHEDYMNQPTEVTDMLNQIHGRLNKTE